MNASWEREFGATDLDPRQPLTAAGAAGVVEAFIQDTRTVFPEADHIDGKTIFRVLVEAVKPVEESRGNFHQSCDVVSRKIAMGIVGPGACVRREDVEVLGKISGRAVVYAIKEGLTLEAMMIAAHGLGYIEIPDAN